MACGSVEVDPDEQWMIDAVYTGTPARVPTDLASALGETIVVGLSTGPRWGPRTRTTQVVGAGDALVSRVASAGRGLIHEEIAWIDPRSGEVRTLRAGPALAPGRLVGGAGVRVSESGDVVSISLMRTYTALWAGGVWTELPADVIIDALGVTRDGVVVGTLQPEPNTTFGAWDPATDTLSLSRSVCPDAEEAPDALVGDTPYVLDVGDASVRITALTLGP